MRPQTAYRIYYDDVRHGSYAADEVPELVLPQVKCEVCGESESTQHAWYPTLHPNLQEIRSVLLELVGDAEIVSTECFREIRFRICKLTERQLWLPGASQLGSLSITMKSFHRPKKLQEKFKRLPDLLDCGVNRLISLKAIEGLGSKGFNVPGGPCVLTWNGLLREDYIALELEPRTLFTPSGQEAWDSWTCDFCGGDHLKEPVRSRGNPRWVEYDVDAFPEQVGISRMREGFGLLASEDFKNAVEALGLTGFTFCEGGRFVKVR
jgi:hypothetical protein